MRLLLSAYACRPNAGSEPGVGWNWATHLASRGIDVHVLVAARNREPIEAGLRANPIPSLHFHYVAVPQNWAKKSEALHYIWWQAEAVKTARKLDSEFHFDLAHHVTYASVHVPSQLWRLGVPVVFGPVGGGQTAPASMLQYFGSERAKEQCRTLSTRALKVSPLHRRWLRRMSAVLAANRDTLNIVQSLGCENASLMCDTAIPTDYFAQEPMNFEERRGTLKLLWVGRMLTRKALPLALDALKEVHMDVKLTIAGDGMDLDAVHRMIRERNLQHRVFWKGSRLTWSELRTAYSEHDAMLFTSLRDSFGSQVLEAMAMGLPIITLDLHGAHDFVPECASLKVAVGRPDETVRNLANAIEQYALLSSPKKNQMSMQAWNFARTLSWSARAEFAEGLYREVISRAKPQVRASAAKVAAVGA
jgi:glycosyltransferase involved in cell wall biosynthesis